MNNRSLEIDITKGLLTIGMIFAHVINLLYNKQYDFIVNLRHLSIDLGTFSGFMFCFGYASWIAYYRKDRIPWKKVLITGFKCYIAFAISGIVWLISVESIEVDLDLITKILFVRDLPPYSEFLVTFSAITILGAVFHKFITIATQRWSNFILTIVLFLSFALLPRISHQDAFISLFIGGGGYKSFPFVHYFPLFLSGVYVARNPHWVNLRSTFTTTCIGLSLFLVFYFLNIPLIQFPPSAGWIISSAGLVFFVLLIAILICSKAPKLIKNYLNLIGQNVLFYLLLSNLSLMFACSLGFRDSLNENQSIIFFLLLMGLILYLQYISTGLTKAEE